MKDAKQSAERTTSDEAIEGATRSGKSAPVSAPHPAPPATQSSPLCTTIRPNFDDHFVELCYDKQSRRIRWIT